MFCLMPAYIFASHATGGIATRQTDTEHIRAADLDIASIIFSPLRRCHAVIDTLRYYAPLHRHTLRYAATKQQVVTSYGAPLPHVRIRQPRRRLDCCRHYDMASQRPNNSELAMEIIQRRQE